MRVAFDVDGTLINKDEEGRDVPRLDVLNLFSMFHKFKCDIYLWSGGGTQYAQQWAHKLGIGRQVTVIPKENISVCSAHLKLTKDCPACYFIDIAVDDQEVNLGRLNMRV